MTQQSPMTAARAHQCVYGCCRATGKKDRKKERRWIKRAERNNWRKENHD